MKILHVYKTYFPDTFGGVEYFIELLAKGLKADGIQSDVFCLTPNQTGLTVVNDVNVHRCKSNITIASTPFSLVAFGQFKKITQQYDLIHYHFPYPFADMLHFVACIDKPSVVTYHSDIVKQKIIYPLYKPLMDSFLKSVSCVVATSPAYLETSVVLQKFKQKTTVIPQGIDESDYPKSTIVGMKSFTTRFGDKFFAFVGVLRYYKGLHILIEAVRNTDIQVVIAGAGPIDADLKKQASEMTNIHFLGAISEQEKVDLLSASIGFVFPSHLRSEAFGISLLEAAMLKKPLISCDIGTGTSYINANDVTGFVVPPNDVAALKNAMKILLSDVENAFKMGISAHERYQNLFIKDKMICSYKNLYEKLIDKRK